MTEGAEENLFGVEQHPLRIDPVDGDGSVHQRAKAVLIADCDAELQLSHDVS